MDQPIVIAHRGASGYRPEHTLAAYELAIRQDADFIEPDLVLTRDHVLIARHDNLLDHTTNVGELAQFAARRQTKAIDGVTQTGWFAEDFTLAEIKTMRARERREGAPPTPFRPANTRFDDQFEIPTFEEIINLACQHGVGIYPETKHPTYAATATGADLSRILLDTLAACGIRHFEQLPTYIQSFEVANLKLLRREMTARRMAFRLVQLLGTQGAPHDRAHQPEPASYDEMATPAGLAKIATYADAVGPEKSHFIIPQVAYEAQPATFVDRAHRAGLQVHPYTFRAENRFLPGNLRGDDPQDPHQLGNLVAELHRFLRTGIDGFFTDHPNLGRQAVATRDKD